VIGIVAAHLRLQGAVRAVSDTSTSQNFGELRRGEVRRIYLLRASVNSVGWSGVGVARIYVHARDRDCSPSPANVERRRPRPLRPHLRRPGSDEVPLRSHDPRAERAASLGVRSPHWEERGFGLWAVEEKSSGAFIGFIGLLYHEDWSEVKHRTEVGWRLARPCWSWGLATEGAMASLRYGFEELGLDLIISIAVPYEPRFQKGHGEVGHDPSWRDPLQGIRCSLVRRGTSSVGD
jgi:RimJ/RimL family protein N-acetyltransferase